MSNTLEKLKNYMQTIEYKNLKLSLKWLNNIYKNKQHLQWQTKCRHLNYALIQLHMVYILCSPRDQEFHEIKDWRWTPQGHLVDSALSNMGKKSEYFRYFGWA